MSSTLKIDDKEFTATLRKIVVNSSREISTVINSRAFHLGKKAMENTPIASRSKIQSDLGATVSGEKLDKKGKVRRRYSYKPTKIIYKIINSRRIKRGEKPLFNSEIDKEAKALISRRLKAVGSLKSGWLRAIGILGFASKQSFIQAGPRVKMSSQATVAKPGFSPEASLTYRVLVGEGSSKSIDPRVVSATERAFNQERQEMVLHLEKKLRETFKKSGA